MLFSILLIVLIYLSARDIYWKFDHGKWSENAKPDFSATIIDISSNKVKYAKNEAKYKTTVTFSDGFIFTTTKTKRKNNFFHIRYQLTKNY